MRRLRIEPTVVHIDEESDSRDPNARESEELPDPGLPTRNVECGEEDERYGEKRSDSV
jgi:hypothetical protein